MKLKGDRLAAYNECLEQLKANYNGGVEYQLAIQQILLDADTAEHIYTNFTPQKTQYIRGLRPILEDTVARTIAGSTTDLDKVLALMRLCRDLYKRDPNRDIFSDADYIYGGTEEQLLEKGEELCECLGRLFVALCEIAGIPARIVIHCVGGHIVSEALVEGSWAYIDPRAGLYFLKEDGSPASTWELWQNPSILRNQPESVRAEVSDRWKWQERIWKCENMFFHPDEVTGFINYSLADSGKYKYEQVSQELATQLGLWERAEQYNILRRRILGLAEDEWRLTWDAQPLRKSSLIYRNDGFSQFFLHTPPMTPEDMCERFIEPMANSNVDILEWGLGPGSVFCYDTKVGQVMGEPLTDKQRAILCEGDRYAWRNVTGMIAQGTCPLEAAIKCGHQAGMKVFTRLEMNHEYGPPSEDNWTWVGLVGDFNKQNPHLRIPGHVNLDYKHKEVRDFKIGILREAAQKGSDCLSIDFAVYPPHLEHPNAEIITNFLHDVRAMADEVGTAQGRRIEMMVRFPAQGAASFGLDWKRWALEGLVDALVPSFDSYGTVFDLDVDQFISIRNRTGIKVYGCMFQTLGFFETDPHPEDEAIGPKYDKAKTPEIWYAQAMLFHRAGVDGIQLAMAADEWNHYPDTIFAQSPGEPWKDPNRPMPFFNDLPDPEKLLYLTKRYKTNQKSPNEPSITLEAQPIEVPIRIGDDPAAAAADGYQATAELILYLNRLLEPGEQISVSINGSSKMLIGADALSWDKPIPERFNYFDPDWWRSGEHTVRIDAATLKLGANTLTFAPETPGVAPLPVRWIELRISYNRK